MSALSDALLPWYRENRRDLPWRSDPTPYHVWLSEIMLQQTRVEAVRDYYLRFLAQVPDIATLARTEDDVLLKLWEGLGYYSRIRNMKKAAQRIADTRQGKLPDTRQELLALPGIGPYTAGAIASIAFGKRAALVDGNVLRVMARLRADTRDITQEKTKKEVASEIEASFLPEKDADCGIFNQALMELGACVCLPNGAPLCASCPVSDRCAAHLEKKETDYPVRSQTKKRRIEKRTVLLVLDRTHVVLKKRPDKGLLAGLYEYPCLQGHVDEKQLRILLKDAGVKALRIRKLPDAKHIFTHIEWRMHGYYIYPETLAMPLLPEGARGALSDVMQGALLADRTQTDTKYAIPSAYAAYTEIARTLL